MVTWERATMARLLPKKSEGRRRKNEERRVKNWGLSYRRVEQSCPLTWSARAKSMAAPYFFYCGIARALISFVAAHPCTMARGTCTKSLAKLFLGCFWVAYRCPLARVSSAKFPNFLILEFFHEFPSNSWFFFHLPLVFVSSLFNSLSPLLCCVFFYIFLLFFYYFFFGFFHVLIF